MLKTQLNAIATRALLEKDFSAAILNGQRKEKIVEFDLDEKEINAVLKIEAVDLDQFIRKLGKLISNASLLS